MGMLGTVQCFVRHDLAFGGSPAAILDIQVYCADRSDDDERDSVARRQDRSVVRANLKRISLLTYRLLEEMPHTLFAVSPFLAIRSAPTADVRH